MLKKKCSSIEVEPLVSSWDSSQVSVNLVIARGAARQLQQWPSHLFGLAMPLCLTTFILLAVTAAALLCIPPTATCRKIGWTVLAVDDDDVGQTPGIYFIKLENRTWSWKEICSIETAARNHPKVNVFMINLFNEEQSSLSKAININSSTKWTVEHRQRDQLARHNVNIKNMEVPLQRFFQGSPLSQSYGNLSEQTLEIAAKAFMLWNYPGVALDPLFQDTLTALSHVFCDNSKEACTADQRAIVEENGHLQASRVACQAFLGYLIQDLIRRNVDDNNNYTLSQTLSHYCPCRQKCRQVKVLSLQPHNSTELLSCPTLLQGGDV